MKQITLSIPQLFVLRQILESDDVEDMARESLEEGEWSKAQFSAFNKLRKIVGLCNKEPFSNN